VRWQNHWPLENVLNIMALQYRNFHWILQVILEDLQILLHQISELFLPELPRRYFFSLFLLLPHFTSFETAKSLHGI